MNPKQRRNGYCRRQVLEGEYFIPDLIYSGEILKGIVALLEPKLKGAQGKEVKKLGKVIIATVEGDIHDIGKDLVVFLLDVSGFDVIDLGIDVPVQTIVDKIKKPMPRLSA